MPINTVSIYFRLFVCLTFASCPRSSVILHFALDRGDFASRLRACLAAVPERIGSAPAEIFRSET